MKGELQICAFPMVQYLKARHLFWKTGIDCKEMHVLLRIFLYSLLLLKALFPNVGLSLLTSLVMGMLIFQSGNSASVYPFVIKNGCNMCKQVCKVFICTINNLPEQCQCFNRMYSTAWLCNVFTSILLGCGARSHHLSGSGMS